jgi:hypothetical protein
MKTSLSPAYAFYLGRKRREALDPATFGTSRNDRLNPAESSSKRLRSTGGSVTHCSNMRVADQWRWRRGLAPPTALSV